MTEAPLDALSLALCGYAAIALCGCEGLPDWLPPRAAFRTVYAAFDADDAGDRAADRLAAQLAHVGARELRLRPDAGAKDSISFCPRSCRVKAIGTCPDYRCLRQILGEHQTATTMLPKSDDRLSRKMPHRLWCGVSLRQTDPVSGDDLGVGGKPPWYSCDDAGESLAAEEYFDVVRSIKLNLNQARRIAAVLTNMGIIAAKNGDHSSAWAYGAESLSLWRELGDSVLGSAALSNLGMPAHDADNYAIAECLIRDSIRESCEIGNRYGEALNLCNLGEMLLRSRCVSEAQREFRTSLELAVSLRATAPIAHCLLNLAYLRALGSTDSLQPDAPTDCLRPTALRQSSALNVPRSRFIDEQERNWLERFEVPRWRRIPRCEAERLFAESLS